MTADSEFSRRKFLATLGVGGGALGAGLLLGDAPLAHAVGGAPGFDPKVTRPASPPRALPLPGERVHEFDIDLTIQVHEILPGVKIHAFTYNKTLPGPEIRVPEGDWVLVNFTNRTSEFHTIHWHGIMLANEMDGVPGGTQWGVGPDQTFKYLFRAQPSGTHFYHCHNMTPLHIQAGMYGALIIEPKVDPIKHVFPYDREYTLILGEMDTLMIEQGMNEMLKMMNTMEAMNRSPNLMREMNGRMMGMFLNKKAFTDAVNSGYLPPYLTAMAGKVARPNMNYFVINGKSYPMTEELRIKTGERIRIRLINAGVMSHFMHLHGHDFWQVCQDGAALAQPLRLNTVPVHPGGTADIIVEGTNPGMWHFHDHSDLSTTNNGHFPGGMMTMLMYDDAAEHGVKVPDIIQVDS